MNHTKNNHPQRTTAGFTVIELILTVTIVVILSTIAYLSIGGYGASARDSSRISDLSDISQAIEMRLLRNTVLPAPSGSGITLYATGSAIGYQWYAGDSVLSNLGLATTGTGSDPLNKSYYLYSTDMSYTKYQLMAFLERQDTRTAYDTPLIPTANAVSIDYSLAIDYTTRYPVSQGKKLGILLWSTGSDTNRPLQEYYDASNFTGIDIANYAGTLGSNSSYGSIKAVVSNTETLIGTWAQTQWLEMNYRGVTELIMNTCSGTWFNASKSIKVGASTSLTFNGITGYLCSAPTLTPINAWIEVVASVCPTGWTTSSDTVASGGNPIKINGTNAVACIVPSSTNIPTGMEVVMSSCPSKWTISSKTLTDGTNPVLFSGVRGNVCVAP